MSLLHGFPGRPDALTRTEGRLLLSTPYKRRYECRKVAQPATCSVSTLAREKADQNATTGCPFHLSAAAEPAFIPDPESLSEFPDVRTPGPKALSLDSLLDVSSILLDGMHMAMLKFTRKYGPVCRFVNPTDLNGVSGWLFINSPNDVQWVCSQNTKNYSSRYLPDIYKYVTREKGILGSQGEYNKKHRRICQPPFRNKDLLGEFAEIITVRAGVLVGLWRRLGRFETDIALQTQRLTLDIVGLTAFSHDFQQTAKAPRDAWKTGSIRNWRSKVRSKNDEEEGLVWAVNTFGDILAQVFITPMPMLRFLQRIGNKHLSLLDKAVGIMRTAMMKVIQDRRKRIAEGEGVPNDLLTALLQVEDEDGQPLTDEELWEDVHDIMGAGHETTATTTAALLYSISAHPHVEANVLRELRSVLGGRTATMEDLEHLPYLVATLKEVLRLYPAIPLFPRIADRADRLPSGHNVLPGDVVFMSSYALGRSLDIWRDADTFRPERFLGAELAAQHRYQFLPFGAGPRMCLGSHFAQMSVVLMAATLIQAFRFKPMHPCTRQIPVDYDITMNFNKTKGLRMEVQCRSS